MTPAELRSRCRVAESCLPKSEYRNRLTILHEDMLTIIEDHFRDATKKVDPLNLNCPSVQARLATAWGYVKARCKYGNEPVSCTSSPMDCQCAIDAALKPECEHDWKYVGTKRQIAFQCSKCGEYTFEAPVQEGWDD